MLVRVARFLEILQNTMKRFFEIFFLILKLKFDDGN